MEQVENSLKNVEKKSVDKEQLKALMEFMQMNLLPFNTYKNIKIERYYCYRMNDSKETLWRDKYNTPHTDIYHKRDAKESVSIIQKALKNTFKELAKKL